MIRWVHRGPLLRDTAIYLITVARSVSVVFHFGLYFFSVYFFCVCVQFIVSVFKLDPCCTLSKKYIG